MTKLVVVALVAGIIIAGGFGVYGLQQTVSLNQKIIEMENTNKSLGEQVEEKENTVSDLTNRFSEISSQNDELKEAAIGWQRQYDSVKDSHEQLQRSYNELDSDYNSLQFEYSSLNLQNKSLKSDLSYYKQLAESERSQRETAESDLAISAKPPYTIIQERQVNWVFTDSKGNTYSWTMPIDTYRKIIEFPEPQDNLSLQADSGKIFTVRDHTKFVDSISFSKVIDDIYDNAGSDYQFLYEIWYITSQLTTYSEDIDEDPRWALETFTEAGGDCEDLTILIASMLKASSHTKDWKIEMWYFDADNPDVTNGLNHMALFVETDEFATFVESTAKVDGLDQWDAVTGWSFEV